MKILQLKLLAFGPFENTVLDLGDGQEGLHIVYGPNEAGKSSALRALRQLLYGIDERPMDGFLHPYPKLRIGGVLRRSDGAVLEFLRRKGRINTLRAPDDVTVIDDLQLSGFLGGADADLFNKMFGIDHEGLDKGGQEILQGGGSWGQILFAAGSGISDLRKVQEQLQAEADDLFKPSAKKPQINEALSLLRVKQKALNEAQLPGQEWLRHDQALREALERKQALDRELAEKQSEKHRLERIKEALSPIARRKELLEELRTCSDAVLLPDDFAERRREAITNLRIAEKDEAQALRDLEEIREALQNLNIPEPLLEHALLISQLQQELGSHRKAMKDRSRLTGQKEEAEADARAILRDLRDDLTLDEAEVLRLDKKKSVRIQELGAIHERLTTKRESGRDEIDRLSLRIERLKEQLAGFETPRDAGELRKAVEHARQQGALEEHYAAECGEIRKAEKAAETALKKLGLWTGTLEELEALPVPSPETIDVFEHRLSKAEGTVGKKRADEEEIERALTDLDGRIEQLRIEQEVPTEEDLLEARRRRDEGWRLVRRAWDSGVQEPEEEAREFIALFQSAKGLTEAYETAVQHADELADRLRREADRVAQKATLLAERETRRNHHLRLKKQLETAEAELATIREEWSDLWQAIGISPKSPREMRAWTIKQAALTEQSAMIRERKAKAESLEVRIEAHRRELIRALESLGESREADGESLRHLLERSQSVLDDIDAIRSRREQLTRELEQQEIALREARSRMEKNEEELAEWRLQWAEAIRFLGLGADAGPMQANTMIQDITTLFAKLRDAHGFQRRIEGIDRDAEDFTHKVRQLAERTAPELAGLPAEQIALELNVRLTQAQTAKARQQSLEQQMQQEEEQLRDARSRSVEALARLATLCDEAGCEHYEDLPAAEERSRRRQHIQTRIDQWEEQLRKLSGGVTLEEFIREVQSVDPDGIDPVLNRLGEEIERLNEEKSELDQTIGSERTELSRMDGSARAAELAEEIQGLLARMESDVEHYARLRIASVVLSQAIEDYREKNQDPILKRSDELFSRMTLGSFEGLRVEINDKGNTVLMGVRPASRELIPVEGMSEGTADQLYLAVRLAALERYLEKSEPLPFIVDDILIKFDDDRAVATLDILAQLSEKTQIVFFTHHRHLVELAEAHVDRGRLFTHSLGG